MAPQSSSRQLNELCPWLPEITMHLSPALTRRHGSSRGPEFYVDALHYAQSQWVHRKPAQAILQLNKAWLADLTGRADVLDRHPPPYRALVWIMREAAGLRRGYLGNPVRHFQHLATRVSGPRSEIRAWRAWVCFHLALNMSDEIGHPRDGLQLSREGPWIPGFQAAISKVAKHGWPGEAEAALGACIAS